MDETNHLLKSILDKLKNLEDEVKSLRDENKVQLFTTIISNCGSNSQRQQNQRKQQRRKTQTT